MDHQRCRGADQKRPSLLQGDEFFHKMLSRNSSVGCSSRIYYRCPEGVPFQWEMQPGTPKHPQKEDVMPPLSPPPAVLSLGLPKPCIEQPKAQTWPRLRFWNKTRKAKKERMSRQGLGEINTTGLARASLKYPSFVAPTVNLGHHQEFQALRPPLCLFPMVLHCSHHDHGVLTGIHFVGLLVAVLGILIRFWFRFQGEFDNIA
ncbi:hypothetical protein CJ030_MR8G016434 [Morella rubra]|uniref:Uncharacterized protein n=1 Tax=Morella rubra TaxID=262757 RepID=A0A6A1UV34_9ROSI|nr:hypothetical protein CJ030_MR8G016434 [Morella rubra]